MYDEIVGADNGFAERCVDEQRRAKSVDDVIEHKAMLALVFV